MNRHEKKTMRARSENYAKNWPFFLLPATHRDSRNTISGQAGFTVVEVMVAVVVFAVGLAAIAGMQTRSIQQSTFSDQMSTRINALAHRAETLTRMAITDETLGLDGDLQIDITTSRIFEEENMCEYGTSCDWSYYIDYEDKKAHIVRQRIVQNYPLPDLVMIELETAPTGVSAKAAKRRTASISYVRSRRFN